MGSRRRILQIVFSLFLAVATMVSISSCDDMALLQIIQDRVNGTEPAHPAGFQQTVTVGSTSFNLHYVPRAAFPKGEDDLDGYSFASSFWIGETEVNYELWHAVRDWAENTANPNYIFANQGREGDDGTDGDPPTLLNQEPVTHINWRDAMIWCNALTEYHNSINDSDLLCVYYSDSGYTTPLRDSRDGIYGDATNYPSPGSVDHPYILADTNGNTAMANCTAKGFRLITSDEWELAARYIHDQNGDGDIRDSGEYYPGNYASGADRDWLGNGSGDIDGDGDQNTSTEVAVFNALAIAAVKSKDENSLGLYDMSGNVWEWCFDWSGSGGSYRVEHGGGWSNDAETLQIGRLYGTPPYNESGNIGFRLAKTP